MSKESSAERHQITYVNGISLKKQVTETTLTSNAVMAIAPETP